KVATKHGFLDNPALNLLQYQFKQKEAWSSIPSDEILKIFEAAESEGDLETAHWGAIAHLRAIASDGNYDILKAAGEKALATAHDLGSDQRVILTLNEVANIIMTYSYQSEWSEALAKEALDLLQQMEEEPYLTVTTLFTLIHLSFKVRNHDQAQIYAGQVELIMDNHPELAFLEAKWLHYQAFIAQTLGDIEEARRIHNELVRLGRVLNEYRIVTQSLFKSVYMARKLAQHNEMLMYAEELFQYVSNQKRDVDEVQMHFFRAFLAECYIVAGDLVRAEEILKPTIPWLDSTDSGGRTVFMCLMTLGDLRQDQGRHIEAIATYRRIVALPRAAGSLTYMPLLCLANALADNEEYQEAEELMAEVDEGMDLSKLSNDLVYYYYVCSLVYQDMLNLSRARSTLFENAHLIKKPKYRRDYLAKYPIARWIYARWDKHQYLHTVTCQVPHLHVPNGKKLEETDLLSVELTIDDCEHDEEVRLRDKKSGLRRHRLKRLTAEAIMQGGSLTHEQLAQLLSVSVRTIERDIQTLRESGIELHTRNYLFTQGDFS
ncbi:MAG: DUF1670 domain-containing protein, partial [Chloroflexota bacterium]